MSEVENEYIYESYGTRNIGIQDLDYFKGTQNRSYRVGLVYHDTPLSKIPKAALEEMKEEMELGMVKIMTSSTGEKILRSPRFFFAPTHYNEKLKTFQCFKGACCKHESRPISYKICTLIVEYSCDKDGNIKKPFTYETKILTLNEKLYNSVKSANKQFTLLENDIILKCENEEYKTYSCNSAKGSEWQKFPEIVEEVLLTAAQHWDRARGRSLGKKITEDQYKTEMGIFDEPPAPLSNETSEFLSDFLDKE